MDKYKEVEETRNIIDYASMSLEHGDEVSNSLLLVLGNTLRDPGNVPDFLRYVSPSSRIREILK
jgi:hypothetical protein